MNIPDLITIIRNAIKANKPITIGISSKKATKFLDILIQAGYIPAYSFNKHGKLYIFLDVNTKKNKIKSLKHISKPSNPVYFSPRDLWKFNNKLGIVVLNTSQGPISHKEAISKNIGGEALCFIL